MKYHIGLDAHHSNCFFHHMDSEGAIGLSEQIATDPDCINELLAQLDEPTTITFEAGRNYWWLDEFCSNHSMVSEVNVVDPRRAAVFWRQNYRC